MCYCCFSRQPAPVDKLLFLNARAKVRRTEAAILISSEAGNLHWWSMYGKKRELGKSNVPGYDIEIVKE